MIQQDLSRSDKGPGTSTLAESDKSWGLGRSPNTPLA
jgi:hypothetical protein